MTTIRECPTCGAYVSEPDDREDDYVVAELCEQCDAEAAEVERAIDAQRDESYE
jgi:hypothetical protein